MPALLLETGIALCSLVLISSIDLLQQLFQRRGQIQLPTHEDGLSDAGRADDPLNVTSPDDMVDGHPILEKEFWENIRARKLVLLAAVTFLALVETGDLCWTLLESKGRSFVEYSALHTAAAFYMVLISAFAIWHPEENTHGRVTIHLAILSTIAVILLTTASMLPSDLALEWTTLVTWYGSLVLWFVAFWISVHMKRGPKLHCPLEQLYSHKILARAIKVPEHNVCGMVDASPWNLLLFSYTTKVVQLGYTAESLEIEDLPVLPGDMRAAPIFAHMKAATRRYRVRGARPGSGWQLAYQLLRANGRGFALLISLVLAVSVLYYGPMVFLQWIVEHLESDAERKNPVMGWVYCAGLFSSSVLLAFVIEQLWSLALTNLQVKIRVQLNTLLFAKTLVRKDVASGVAEKSVDSSPAISELGAKDELSSKAQVMTLMTTDVDRVAEFVWHFYTLIDSPIEIAVGTFLLYRLLGVSSFMGLAVICLFLPVNNYAGRVVIHTQKNLMEARSERVSLMNEVLGAIRMLKFMAWERNFEERILKIRERELKHQRKNYAIELLFITIWNTSPLLITLVTFWHFTVSRQQALTPSIAFTSIASMPIQLKNPGYHELILVTTAVFSKLKYALNALPGTLVKALQSFVSIQRIEEYLSSAEVKAVDPPDASQNTIRLRSATIAWPREGTDQLSVPPSTSSAPHRAFSLVDVNLDFPLGELSLICGKLGSGKSLLLLSLLGEADLLSGNMSCPRSPPNAIASSVDTSTTVEHWIVKGTCAYAPQTAWLQNATIKGTMILQIYLRLSAKGFVENILFNLPYVEERYRKTLEACALVDDLAILEDGDQSEIGEQGINLSGGQKARVSLARAMYSRASILLLDDVLSAVDAHTAHHLHHECLKGELSRGRTIILVSHHVQLCAPGAKYVVALDGGRVSFSGTSLEFQKSSTMMGLVQSQHGGKRPKRKAKSRRKGASRKGARGLMRTPSSSSLASMISGGIDSDAESVVTTSISKAKIKVAEKRSPRKLIDDEKRAVGSIGRHTWKAYFSAVGGPIFWLLFVIFFTLAAVSPVAERGWLSHWSGTVERHTAIEDPLYYISVYALISLVGLVASTVRWLVLYKGSIHASIVTYKKILETVLFAPIRFHDTVSRGRLLNRFGKDMEVIDSLLPDDFGNSIIYFTSACATILTITYLGGPWFCCAALILGFSYYNVAKIYGRCCRELRRLESISRSPLYSIYGETISGVPVLRAFGAGSKFMRDMLCFVNEANNPYYWLWKVNRWVSTRINLLSSVITGATAVVALVNPNIDASLAGFTLVFATTVTLDLQFLIQRFVQLETSMVAVERVKEYSDLPREAPEIVEPRPDPSWPSKGSVECKGLVVRYSPELPDVLHDLNFKVNPGEKVGILGRTGSGKSTLALSFFRFVEATEGRILVDGVDISKIGLTDLRSKLTIIPQDPIVLSGTLRSALDVFDEYMDAELYEVLRRVRLIPPKSAEPSSEDVNENVFSNLDSPVYAGGDNFSAGEKQLLCLARAILKHSKLLVMDEATASVDYATDELIGKTIRHEFADSTILTIAHRLRTVIDYNRVLILDQGRIVEYDRPATLLSNPTSYFYALCKAEGEEEFEILKKIAGAV